MNSNILTIQERAANIMKAVGCDSQNIDLIKGEGDRGGKVIGHTKSGKPIYMHNAVSYSDFNKEDHEDAMSEHYKKSDEENSKGNKDISSQHSEIASQHAKESKKKKVSDKVAKKRDSQRSGEKGDATNYYNNNFKESDINKIKSIVSKNEKTLGRKLKDDEIDHILLNHDFHSSIRGEMIKQIKKKD